MDYFISAIFGLMLTTALVLTIITIGRYGLYLLDQFEDWYRRPDSDVDTTTKE